LEDLHAAERAADRGGGPVDAEVREQRTLRLYEVGDGQEREAEAVGPAGSRVGG